MRKRREVRAMMAGPRKEATLHLDLQLHNVVRGASDRPASR